MMGTDPGQESADLALRQMRIVAQQIGNGGERVEVRMQQRLELVKQAVKLAEAFGVKVCRHEHVSGERADGSPQADMEEGGVSSPPG